ncbi:MAG: hypothetical protein EAZ89_06000 [Bacteroidetes bacterium]|nr:MAG: hypothetical protein EAZ89_06000 [Bacteroidota bacterium]
MKKTGFLLAFTLGFFAAAFAQSGWVKEKGQYFVKADLAVFQSRSYYNPLGTKVITSVFSQQMLNLYAEYGLGKRLALQGSFPVLRFNRYSGTQPAIGQGDLKLEVKYALLKGKTPLSLTISPELPTGRANAFANNKNIPGDQINLPTGDGEFNVWTTLALSRGFGKVYATIWSAYNVRTQYKGEIFQDVWQAGAEIGGAPAKNLWINAKLRTQTSMGASVSPNLGFVRGDASEFTQVSLGAYYKFRPKGGIAADLSAISGFLQPLTNMYAGSSFSLGWVWEY